MTARGSKPRRHPCVHPDCSRIEHCRGLCRAHYEEAFRLVKRGEATEADLMRRGLLLKARKRGPGCNANSVFRLGKKARGKRKR